MSIALRVFLLFAALVGTHSASDIDPLPVADTAIPKKKKKVMTREQELEHEEDEKERKAEEEKDFQMQKEKEERERDIVQLSVQQLREIHTKFDEDHDGKVSLQEVTTYFSVNHHASESKQLADMLKNFILSDTNKDGSLSLEEHLADPDYKEQSGLQGIETVKFKAADLNNDGLLDKTEMPHLFSGSHEGVMSASLEEVMRQNDGNKDGKLSPSEFAKIDVEKPSGAQADEFAALDIDGDGLLSGTEMRLWESSHLNTKVAIQKLFYVADKDKDGHLTEGELESSLDNSAGSDDEILLTEALADVLVNNEL